MIQTEMGTTKITVTDKEREVRKFIASILNEQPITDFLNSNKNAYDEATCFSDLCSIYLAMIDKFGERTAAKLTVKAIDQCYHNYIKLAPYTKED